MTNLEITPVTEKERAEHVAKTTPALQVQKKEQAKRARAADTVAKARKGRQAESNQSLAENPLASPNVAKPKSAGDNIWDYPFPAPGLVYYAAKAAALQVETDRIAMNVYANLEQDEFKIINTQLNQQAIKERDAIQSQASSTMWGAIAQMGMGAAGIAGGGFGIYKMGTLANEQVNLTNERSSIEAELTNRFKLNAPDLEAEQEGEPVQQTINDRRVANLRVVKVQTDAIRDLRELALNPNGNWADNVNAYFDENAPNVEGLSEESAADVNNTWNASRDAVLSKPVGDLEAPEINQAFDDMQDRVNAEDRRFERGVELEKVPIQAALDAKDAELEANKQATTKAQNYISIGQGVGQLLNVLNFGSYAATMRQAQASYDKTKAQQLQTTNESIRQEVARQWSSLAQNQDAALQTANQVFREINSVMQRA